MQNKQKSSLFQKYNKIKSTQIRCLRKLYLKIFLNITTLLHLYYNAKNEAQSILNLHTSTDWPEERMKELTKTDKNGIM